MDQKELSLLKDIDSHQKENTKLLKDIKRIAINTNGNQDVIDSDIKDISHK